MKSFITKYYNIIFLFFIVIIAGFSFILGYEEGSGNSKSSNNDIVFSCPGTILDKQKIPNLLPVEKNIIETKTEEDEDSPVTNKGVFVGSKNGTKYYTPGCSGTNRIKPENYIWFQSVEDATLQGYSKGSC